MDRDVPPRPFRIHEAPTLGVSRRQLSRLRDQGVLSSPVRGVLMRADDEHDVAARVAAVALVLPPGAAVCRSMAAWLHGVDLRAPWQRMEPIALDCMVRRGREPPSLAGVAAHVDLLEDGDITCVDGVPVTTVERTALDIARFSPPHMALAALDALTARKAVNPDALAVRIEAWRGLRGIVQARQLIAWIDAGSESFGESWLRLRMLNAGFPRPKTQIWINGRNGTPLYRLDLGWDEVRIAVEYDGLEFHDAREQRAHDIARRQDLERRFGWTVIGVGRGEVLGTSLALERGVGALLGMTPQIMRRTW